MAASCSVSTIMRRLLVLDTVNPSVILEEKIQNISEMTLQAENLTLLVKAEDPLKVGLVKFTTNILSIFFTCKYPRLILVRSLAFYWCCNGFTGEAFG